MPVPYDQNAAILSVSIPMSDGSFAATLPATLTLASDNPNVAVSIHNSGERELRVVRLVPGPVSAIISASLPSLPPAMFVVDFDGVPPPAPTGISLSLARTGTV